MATNVWRQFKRGIPKVTCLTTNSGAEKLRQYGDGMRRRCGKGHIYLNLPQGNPVEPASAVMVNWPRGMIMLFFDRTAVRMTVVVVAASRGNHFGQRRGAVDLMVTMPATAKKRMATYRNGRQDGKDCFHEYPSLLQNNYRDFRPVDQPALRKSPQITQNFHSKCDSEPETIAESSFIALSSACITFMLSTVRKPLSETVIARADSTDDLKITQLQQLRFTGQNLHHRDQSHLRLLQSRHLPRRILLRQSRRHPSGRLRHRQIHPRAGRPRRRRRRSRRSRRSPGIDS